MTVRMPIPRTKKTFSLAFTNAATADYGEMIAIDTSSGLLNSCGTSTTLIPIGYANTPKQALFTGDGVTPLNVDLFDNLTMHFFDNDTAGNAVVATDIGASCYVKDAHTVSHLSTGRSVAGMVLAVDPVLGVGVLFGLPVKGATGDSIGVAQSVADRTALGAVVAGSRYNGMVVLVRSDNTIWRFDSTSTLTDASQEFVMVPAAGTGAWIRQGDRMVLKLALAYTTADAAALFTVPTGYEMKVDDDPHYDITIAFSGGTSSAIGVSSDLTAASTKGDLLGGSGGDVAASLGTGIKLGTAGGKMGTIANRRANVLLATNVIRFDRIASAFTAGAGFVHVPVTIKAVG